MWYTNIHINMIVYQKYTGTSIKVGCATRSLYASSSIMTDNARHIGPTALLVRVQRLRNDLYNVVKDQVQDR